MPRRRIEIAVVATILMVFAATAASAGAAEPAAQRTLSASGVTDLPCFEAGTDGPGVEAFEVVAPASFNYMRVELEGASGDWDVAALSHGTVATAAATSGSSEVATGFAVSGETIRIQGCRAPGASPTAQVGVYFTRQDDPNGPPPKLLRVQVDGPADRAALETAGLDPAESAGPGFSDIVAYGPADRATLARLGFPYTTLKSDLGRGALNGRSGRRASASMPSGRTEYRRLFDYEQELKDLADRYPDLVELFTLPKRSLEGRAIEAIELGDNPGVDEGEPVFLQLGLHHGREWPAGEVTLEWAYELLEGAEAGDPEAVRRLEDSTTIVAPVVNPDGFNASREAGQIERDYGVRLGDANAEISTLGLEFQRKNCRVPGKLAGDCGMVSRSSLGVDPNRNYGVNWGGNGAGLTRSDETFRGARPFSEPEVANVRSLVEGHQVIALSSQHSYASLMLHPPGVRGTGPTPDARLYRRLGAELGRQTGYDSVPGHRLYDSSGVLDDWSYGATGAITFTPELGLSDFHPAFGQVLREWHGDAPRAEGGMRGSFYALSGFVLNASRHAVIAGSGPPNGRLELRKRFTARTARVIKPNYRPGERRKFRNRVATTVAVGPGGAFEAHLNPSTSPLLTKRKRRAVWRAKCFDASGAEIGQRMIRVERGRRLELDLAVDC